MTRQVTRLFLPLLLCLMPLTGMGQSFNSLAQRAGSAMQNSGSKRSQSKSQGSSKDDEEDPCVEIDDHRQCWTQDPITGIHFPQVPDTTHINLGARQTMEGQSLGLLHTGNLYSPHHIVDFFDQRPQHDYLFLNAYPLFAYRPENLLLYNTRLPYTTASYVTSGSSNESNDRLRLNFAGNINRQMGIGSFLDYVYARGEYSSQATKPLNWTSYFYYDSDQYKATLSFNLSKLANQENGGIADRSYVLNPDAHSDVTRGYNIPTCLVDTWNDMDGLNLHFNHSYDLGTWDEVPNAKDTTQIDERFTSVSSIFHSIDFEHYSHQFRMDAKGDQTLTDSTHYFPNYYIDKDCTLDSTAYSSFSTYAGMRINEGFSRWSQFGLAAFIGYQHQSYTMMQDTTRLDFIGRHHTSDNIFIGGQLSRQQSRRLTFDATAKVGIWGDKRGDIDVTGHLQTVLPAGRKDSITVQASGYYRLQTVSYMMDHFFSNHFAWSNDFSQEQRVRLEGKFRYSLTGTEAKVGLEHINDYHYFGPDGLPYEYNDLIEVVSTEISQRLHWRALHWDNRLLFQYCSHDDVLPMPSFAIESDLNLRFVIAHALTAQLGITGYYYNKYYVPDYQPATQQFVMQRQYKSGDYPLFNAYLNCNLKKIKFFVMYTNIGTQLISNDAFLMPFYPLQSSRLQYGISFDLQN